MNFDCDQINEQIIIGSCPFTDDDLDDIVIHTNATAVLSLQDDHDLKCYQINVRSLNLKAEQLNLIKISVPMRDFDPRSQASALPQAVMQLKKLLDQGHRVYVHCTAGINRSPLVVLAYFVFIEKMPISDALKTIKQKRSKCEPYLDAVFMAMNQMAEFSNNDS